MTVPRYETVQSGETDERGFHGESEIGARGIPVLHLPRHRSAAARYKELVLLHAAAQAHVCFYR